MPKEPLVLLQGHSAAITFAKCDVSCVEEAAHALRPDGMSQHTPTGIVHAGGYLKVMRALAEAVKALHYHLKTQRVLGQNRQVQG